MELEGVQSGVPRGVQEEEAQGPVQRKPRGRKRSLLLLNETPPRSRPLSNSLGNMNKTLSGTWRWVLTKGCRGLKLKYNCRLSLSAAEFHELCLIPGMAEWRRGKPRNLICFEKRLHMQMR